MTDMRARCVVAFACLSFCALAHAFESDVHFGLTQWLALQAGFSQPQADAIAIGSNRVDSGDMQYLDLLFVYGCLEPDAEAARDVAKRHYPTGGAIPGTAEQRSIVPGSAAAHRALDDLAKARVELSGSLLYKFGEALHTLQNSWSHQGTPDTPQPERAFACDATLAFAHPRARGGWNSHRADHTVAWPADTLAMAKATYDAMLRYPPIMGQSRAAKNWDDVRLSLDGFIKAATKTEKKAWLVKQGINDVSFLTDTTLKDGAEKFLTPWPGRKLPELKSIESRQHYVDADIRQFYSRFFADWMTTDNFDALASAYAADAKSRRELGAALTLWRMRDHGAIADLAHAQKPLTPKQFAAIATMAKAADALVRYAAPQDAFVPLITKGNDASPLLPFIVGRVRGSTERLVATAKLKHAPYDIVAVVADRIDGRWRVVSIVSSVDH